MPVASAAGTVTCGAAVWKSHRNRPMKVAMTMGFSSIVLMFLASSFRPESLM